MRELVRGTAERAAEPVAIADRILVRLILRLLGLGLTARRIRWLRARVRGASVVARTFAARRLRAWPTAAEQVAAGLDGLEARVAQTVQRVLADQTGRAARQWAAELRRHGVLRVVDGAGRSWRADAWTRMVVRTAVAEQLRDEAATAAREQGRDMVRVTGVGSTHPACQVWEGSRLSLDGRTPGLPTVAQARAAGLFHPGCAHGYE